MARKPRVEFEGAKYHVIGRGNYRKPVFGEEGSGEAFERTLFEAAERQGWRIHAFAIMSNHYHVALETPMPNLSEGMGWLLGCFATRFNRFRGEQGSCFSGTLQGPLGGARAMVAGIARLHPSESSAGWTVCFGGIGDVSVELWKGSAWTRCENNIQIMKLLTKI